MTAKPTGVWAFYQGWDAYQEVLSTALAPLTPDQLMLRSTATLRSVSENCLHIIGARVRWCHELMELGDAAFAAMGQWDRPNLPTRTAPELVAGLRSSWQVLQAALQQWTPADLEYVYPNDEREPGEPESYTRQWVVWHLIEHDIHHGGEISQILGMHGVVGIDL